MNYKINLKNIMKIHLNPRDNGLKAAFFASCLLAHNLELKASKADFIKFVQPFYHLTGKELDGKLNRMAKYGIISKESASNTNKGSDNHGNSRINKK